jgi:hypothetical protein
VHQLKHDGYRLIVRRDGAAIRLFTRRGSLEAAIWSFLVGKHTLPRMDKPMHLSFTAWLLLGAMAYVVWILNAVVEGSSTFAIIAGPLLVLLWIAAVLVVDRWVTGGANQPE